MLGKGLACLQTGGRVARPESRYASFALLDPAFPISSDDPSSSLRGNYPLTLAAACAFSLGLALRRVSEPHAVGSDLLRHLGPGWR